MTRRSVVAAAAVWATIAPAFAASDDLPKALAGELVATERATCDTSTGYDTGFVIRRDIDGDGRADVVLDYSRALCGGVREPYCEGDRCLLQAWQAVGNGWRKVFDGRAATWRIDSVGGRPTLLVDGRPIGR